MTEKMMASERARQYRALSEMYLRGAIRNPALTDEWFAKALEAEGYAVRMERIANHV